MNQQPLITTDPGQGALLQKKFALEARLRSGINWFFWIGGLSIINSIIYFLDGSLTFVVGLGATQFVDGFAGAVAKDLSSSGATLIRIIGFSLDLGIAGIFIAAGLLGRKRYRWAVITGMVLYTFDAIIFLLVGGWLAVAFHGLALWGLWGGLKAIGDLNAVEQTIPVSITPNTEKPVWYKSDSARILVSVALFFLAIVVILVTIGFIING